MPNHAQLKRLVESLPDIYVRYELALRQFDYFALPLRDRKLELLGILEEERNNAVNLLGFHPVLDMRSEIRQCSEFINQAILTVRDPASAQSDLESVNSRIYFLRLRIQRLNQIFPNTQELQILHHHFEALIDEMNMVNVPMTDVTTRDRVNFFEQARPSDIPNTERLSDISPPFSGFGSGDLNRPGGSGLSGSEPAPAHSTNPFARMTNYANDLLSHPNLDGAIANIPIINNRTVRVPTNDRFIRWPRNDRSTPIYDPNRNNNNMGENSFNHRPENYNRQGEVDNHNREKIWQWNLKFTGDNSDMSASEFLQILMDRCMSRNVSREDLLHSMFDLLGGTALRWYRSRTVSNPFRNWDEFVNKFLEDFEPFHQNDGLLETIRKRKQSDNESIVKFFATVEDMFWRLHNVPSEGERIAIIRKNLQPRFIEKLSLHHFDTVEALKDACKMAEYGFKLANDFERSNAPKYPQAQFNRNFSNNNVNRQSNNNRGAPVQPNNNYRTNANPRYPNYNGNNNPNFNRNTNNVNNFRQRSDNFVDNRGRSNNAHNNVNVISHTAGPVIGSWSGLPEYNSGYNHFIGPYEPAPAGPPNYYGSYQPNNFNDQPNTYIENSQMFQSSENPSNGIRNPSALIEPPRLPPSNTDSVASSNTGSGNETGTLSGDGPTVPLN